jgi:hypothetical protein
MAYPTSSTRPSRNGQDRPVRGQDSTGLMKVTIKRERENLGEMYCGQKMIDTLRNAGYRVFVL